LPGPSLVMKNVMPACWAWAGTSPTASSAADANTDMRIVELMRRLPSMRPGRAGFDENNRQTPIIRPLKLL
jgi:hypothetical protein